jgi:hypothetical protein
VPSSEWPACKYNKLYFASFGGDRLFVGFHVEKGLGASVKAAYPRMKGYFTEDDWQWLKFVRALEDGTFQAQLSIASADMPVPVVLRLSGYYVQDPKGYDPYSPLRKPDVSTFEMDSSSSGTFTRKSVDLSPHAIPQLEVTSISNLADELNRLNADPWLWIDVHIGVPFTIQAEVCDGCWGADKMWAAFLQRFRGTVLFV